MKACWHFPWEVISSLQTFIVEFDTNKNGSSRENEIFGWAEKKVHWKSKKWSVRDKELFHWLFEKLHHSWVQVHFWKRTLVHQVKFSISNDFASWFFFFQNFLDHRFDSFNRNVRLSFAHVLCQMAIQTWHRPDEKNSARPGNSFPKHNDLPDHKDFENFDQLWADLSKIFWRWWSSWPVFR